MNRCIYHFLSLAWRRVRLGPGTRQGVLLLLLQEADQGLVDLVRVSPRDRVRTAFDDDELAVLDERRQALAGVRIRQDAVGVTLNEQHRGVDLGQVGAEVRLPGR